MKHQRKINKSFSFKKIIQAASTRYREQGFTGAGIASIMKDAGLTHGTFYSHFSNKDELMEKAFQHALSENRSRWIKPADNESWVKRLRRLSKRYLTEAHRDELSNSCALASLVSDAARSHPAFRCVYENELNQTLRAICDPPNGDEKNDAAQRQFDEALMFMALMVGGISLSRAVNNETLSKQILHVCQIGSERLASEGSEMATSSKRGIPPVSMAMDQPLQTNNIHDRSPDKTPHDRPSNKKRVIATRSLKDPPKPGNLPITLDQFPAKTYEKLRYADTDRQGHVNNAVFSTMLETGRVEILYDPSKSLHNEQCAFVIAHQSLDYQSEITWPGVVDIGSRVASIGQSSIKLEHALFQNGQCVATAKVVIVQMNEKTRKSEPLHQESIQYLSRFME